ncbi:15293_t:CDS:2, partial [Gigaspora rosea]
DNAMYKSEWTICGMIVVLKTSTFTKSELSSQNKSFLWRN